MKKLLQYRNIILTGLLLGLYLLSMINSAWLSDDCFISLSQIVNLHNGDGLVYNFGERVQAFTHPTWFFLLSLLTWMTGEYYYTIIAASIAASMFAVYIVFHYAYIQKNAPAAIIGLTILLFSKAFMDYTSSGLENPLSYLLLSWILYALLMKSDMSKQLLILVYIAMALLFLNRMDYALILFPILIHLLIRYKSKNITPFMIAAFLVLAWFLFSLLYFGHFFPNTYYAKLQAGYPAQDYLQRGLQYFKVQYESDPVTLIIIATGIILGLIRKGIMRTISIGLVLYLLYFLKSGGDFMQGRFFAVPAFVAIVLIVSYLTKIKLLEYGYVLIVAILLLGSNSTSPLFVGKEYNNRNVYLGVADERGFYFQRFGMISPKRSWPKITTLDKAKPKEVGIICGGLGTAGLSKRNKVYFIDYCALTDPLLSQLPAIENSDWRVGHQYRHTPINYKYKVLDNNITLFDKNLDELYNDIHQVTHESLFDQERLISILKINTHNYNIDTKMYKSPNMLVGAKKVWKGSELPTVVGNKNDTSIIVRTGSNSGVASFGPYEVLSSGRYKFDIYYVSSEANSSSVGSWDVAIALQGNAKRIKEGMLVGTNNNDGHIIKEFTVPKEFANNSIEIRSFYSGKGSLTIKSLTITRVE